MKSRKEKRKERGIHKRSFKVEVKTGSKKVKVKKRNLVSSANFTAKQI